MSSSPPSPPTGRPPPSHPGDSRRSSGPLDSRRSSLAFPSPEAATSAAADDIHRSFAGASMHDYVSNHSTSPVQPLPPGDMPGPESAPSPSSPPPPHPPTLPEVTVSGEAPPDSTPPPPPPPGGSPVAPDSYHQQPGFPTSVEAMIDRNLEGLYREEAPSPPQHEAPPPPHPPSSSLEQSVHSVALENSRSRRDSAVTSPQNIARVPSEPRSPVSAAPDWQSRCQVAERRLYDLEQRNAAMDRLMQSSGQSSNVKVRQLSEEITRKNQRIKELEKKNASQATALQDVQNQLHSLHNEARRQSDRRKTPGGAQGSGGVGSSDISLTDQLRAVQERLHEVTKEKDKLLRASSSNLQSQAAPQQVQAPQSPQGGEMLQQARDCISGLRRSCAEKDCELEALRKKLTDAQSAIITNVDGIAELDSKLQQSRKALRWLLRANQVSPSHSRSPSPQHWGAGGGGAAAQAPPTYASRGRSGGGSVGYAQPAYTPPGYGGGGGAGSAQFRSTSASPSGLMQQHDMLSRSHLGPEQLQALKELETMLAARESAQRQQLPRY